jgi:hypothetical protein
MRQLSKSRLEPLRYLDGLVAALVVVGLGFLIGFLGILKVRQSDTGSGEAFAALAAAVVGIGGAQIGQATGIRRGGPEPLAHREHAAVDAALIPGVQVERHPGDRPKGGVQARDEAR